MGQAERRTEELAESWQRVSGFPAEEKQRKEEQGVDQGSSSIGLGKWKIEQEEKEAENESKKQ